jgi:hypothetical protein
MNNNPSPTEQKVINDSNTLKLNSKPFPTSEKIFSVSNRNIIHHLYVIS